MFCPLLWRSIQGNPFLGDVGNNVDPTFRSTDPAHVAFGDQDLYITPNPNPELFPKNCCLDPGPKWNLLRRRTWSDLKLVIFFFPYNPFTPPTPTNPPPVPPRKARFRSISAPFGSVSAPFGSVWLRFGSVSGPFRDRFGSVSGCWMGWGWGRGEGLL